tara:strand:- start:8786 stop:9670 length:885 start_codon:yes stop_codon:yes gene_type:complete
MKYSIFHLEGGLGKHVAATAVAKAIKNNYPDRELIVVCAWPEVFLNLPFIDRVYRIGNTPYFYKDYIQEKDSLIFKHEPYFTTDHVHKRKSLIQNWIELYGMEFNGELPELKFNYRQEQFGFNKWKRDAPVLVMHTNGGPLKDQPFPYSWTRDMPPYITQALVEQFKSKYHIIQVCRDESQAIAGVHEVVHQPMSNMELFYLMQMSNARILIDSSLQHAAAAMGMKSTVLWIGTSPTVFGYDGHDNIIADLGEETNLPDSYLFDYNFNGALHECPMIDTSKMFNLEEITSTILQ